MNTIGIVGSTGSIGDTTLKILKKYRSKFKIIFLYADKNYKKLNLQSKFFKPTYIGLNSTKYLNKIKNPCKILNSIDSLLNKKKKIDYIVSAASGFSSLALNFKLIQITKKLLIANKETIICGGDIFLNYAKKYGCEIVPIDSEHYCINYFLQNFKNKNVIKSFFLTASGGPFLKKKPKKNIPIQKVLDHPNWKMGKKNSINSANMTNKVMELFEAYILFKIPINQLKIKIDKTSKIHSIISLNNNLDFMISHDNDMSIPIENSLIKKKKIILSNRNISDLDFFKFELMDVDEKRFPIIKTGYKVLKLGYRAMIIFTVINDRLVELFLTKKKNFNDITKIINEVFSKLEIVNYSKKDIRSFSDIINTIKFAENINI